MQDVEQYFYKYTVVCYVKVDEKPELKTVSGLTFGKTFNEVCNKLTDYFGEDTIEEMKIEFANDCDVLEEDELIELFNFKKNNTVFDEIKTNLTEAIGYEKGNLNTKTTTLSTDDEENTEDKEEN